MAHALGSSNLSAPTILKGRKMICDRCHQEKTSAVPRLNPYYLDIHGEEKEEKLCDGCYDALCDEI